MTIVPDLSNTSLSHSTQAYLVRTTDSNYRVS